MTARLTTGPKRTTADESGMLAVRHAAENASTEPIDDAGIAAILRGEGGSGSHQRAIFGDASLGALLAAGAACGIGRGTILAAYRVARETVAAANPELDRALEERW